jgi:hypothetical protein
MKLYWQKIKNTGEVSGVNDSKRAKVPGGWLVMVWSGSITFLPDPNHQWDGNSLN